MSTGYQVLRTDHSILSEAREKLGLSQQEAADRAKVSLEQYQRYEKHGEWNLESTSFDIATRVLTAVGLDPSAYANGEYHFRDADEETERILAMIP
jgi:transcriptional regulator with XRE-family HTH domain